MRSQDSFKVGPITTKMMCLLIDFKMIVEDTVFLVNSIIDTIVVQVHSLVTEPHVYGISSKARNTLSRIKPQ